MINELNEILANYGWTGVLFIVGIIILMKYFDYILNKQNKKSSENLEKQFNKISSSISNENKKLIENLMNQNNEMLSKLIYNALENKSKADKSEHLNSIYKRFSVSKHIHSKLHDLVIKYDCDRAFILEFHNSKQNMSGLSFLWYDMVYEEVAKGVNSIQSLYKDQDTSTLLSLINDINENNGYVIYSTEELNELQNKSSALYSRLRLERDLREAILVGLYSSSNLLLGILVLEYENTNFINTNDLDEDDIISQATAIATLLDYSINIKSSENINYEDSWGY